MLVTPSPPFWPEKATEWIALVGGALGGVLAPLAFLLSILNYSRDRAKVRLRYRRGMVVRATGYDPNDRYFLLQVINEGRREVQIARADGNFYKGDGFLFTDSLFRGAPVLSEKSPEAVFLAKEGSFKFEDVCFFSAFDGAQREYRVYVNAIPKRWVRALWHWPARVKLRHEVRNRRREKLEEDELLIGNGNKPV